jgi:D,D-heptose 1,7-bisphosphate phosphatase
MNKAIFIDKDGTLVRNIPYNVDPSLVELESGAALALKLFKERGYLLIVISNQAGVAHNYFAEEALEGVKTKIQQLVSTAGVQLDGFYFCPHHPDGSVKKYTMDCECRKPQAGMLLQAALDFDIELSKSWMIGDILNDVEAGNKAGCKTILIDNGNETEWISSEIRYPTYIVRNMKEAAAVILESEYNVEPTYQLFEHH